MLQTLDNIGDFLPTPLQHYINGPVYYLKFTPHNFW